MTSPLDDKTQAAPVAATAAQTRSTPPLMSHHPPAQPAGYSVHMAPYFEAAPPPAYYVMQPEPPAWRLIYGIMAFFFVVSIVLFVLRLALRPSAPVFRVESLAVSGFDTTNHTMAPAAARWDAALAVENPNENMPVEFEEGSSTVSYRDSLLSKTHVTSLEVGEEGRGVLHATFPAEGFVPPASTMAVVAVADRDRRATGVVRVSLKMLMWAKYDAGWWIWHFSFKVSCEGLVLGFVANSGDGSLVAGSPRDCMVFL